jgi:hypothetical protein
MPAQPPAHDVRAWTLPRADAHRLGNLVEGVGADGPAKQPRGRRMRSGHPASERALGGLCFVDDRDQLDVGLIERHDPVGSAPAGWPPPSTDASP